jgi:Secretion system C-terminal sorting domain/Prolyl oligopeptidase family
MNISRRSIRILFILTIYLLSVNIGRSQTYTITEKPGSGATKECGGYVEFLPPNFNPSGKYPLIIFLHGAGEQGNGTTDLNKLYTGYYSPTSKGIPSMIASNTFPEFIVGGTPYSFIVVAPQCTFNAGLKDIEDYINYFLSTYSANVDPNRVFLTGLSIGGTRVWTAGGTNLSITQKFAGIAAVAGGADNDYRKCTTANPQCTFPDGQKSDGSDFDIVVSNLADNGGEPKKPKVVAVHGLLDFNLPYGTDFVNGINSINSASTARLVTFAGDHDASFVTGYALNTNLFPLDASGTTMGNMYQWMLTQAAILLPVTLTSFDAIAKNNAVDLTWNTESESNSSHFAVERSSNGREFKEIGRVKSSGNSTTAKNYKFTDNNPLSGNNYYRLKMVDLDATFKYSEVRRVSMNGSDLEFSFGPNPVINEANIRITGNQRTRLNVTVTDLMGRTLKSMSFSKTDIVFSQKINLAELPAGQYVLSVKGDNVNHTQRIMKR